MKSLSSSSLCSLLFFTLCITLISQTANAKHALMGQVCGQALQEKVACMSILRSDPRILHAKNYRQFAELVLQLGLKKAIAGQNFLKGIAAVNKSPAIVQCANFDYDGVVGSFKSAIGELESDAQTASYDAKVAGDGPDTCERGLASEHIVNPAISGLNREILLLSNIAFIATDKLD